MQEGEDFYFNEQGLMVFTSVYHLKRGYCCKNNCLHCPWKKKKTKAKLDSAQGNSNKEEA